MDGRLSAAARGEWSGPGSRFLLPVAAPLGHHPQHSSFCTMDSAPTPVSSSVVGKGALCLRRPSSSSSSAPGPRSNPLPATRTPASAPVSCSQPLLPPPVRSLPLRGRCVPGRTEPWPRLEPESVRRRGPKGRPGAAPLRATAEPRGPCAPGGCGRARPAGAAVFTSRY